MCYRRNIHHHARLIAALLLACLSLTSVAQGSAEQGFRLMSTASGGNCVACHAWAGQAGRGSDFGPSLAGVGTRYSAERLQQWVFDARRVQPNTLMPPFGTTEGTHVPLRAQPILTTQDIADVVTALQTLR